MLLLFWLKNNNVSFVTFTTWFGFGIGQFSKTAVCKSSIYERQYRFIKVKACCSLKIIKKAKKLVIFAQIR